MAYCFILYKNQMNVKHILITKLNIYIRSAYSIFDTINIFYLCCFSGWWSWNVFECGSICSLGLIMHVFANLHHQNFHSQMGSSHVHVLLYSIHCNSILPPILYNNPRSNHCWNRSCPDVECEVYIPNSSKNIKNIEQKIHSIHCNSQDVYI